MIQFFTFSIALLAVVLISSDANAQCGSPSYVSTYRVTRVYRAVPATCASPVRTYTSVPRTYSAVPRSYASATGAYSTAPTQRSAPTPVRVSSVSRVYSSGVSTYRPINIQPAVTFRPAASNYSSSAFANPVQRVTSSVASIIMCQWTVRPVVEWTACLPLLTTKAERRGGNTTPLFIGLDLLAVATSE